MPFPAIRLTTGMPRPWLLFGLAALAAGPVVSQPVAEERNPAKTQIGLTPESPIRGVVTDASGAAIEGARIRARPRNALVTPFNSLQMGSATSASDGSFSVDEVVHGHPYRLVVQAAGYASGFLDLPPIEPGAAIDPVHVVLGRGRQVHGTAVDTDGNPVAEARVSLLWPLVIELQPEASGDPNP